jgi:hypothetical protein
MLVLILLPMLIDYFNGRARERSIGITAKFKIMGEPSSVFIGLWFGFIWLPYKNTRLCPERRQSLKTSKICSFLLDFIL